MVKQNFNHDWHVGEQTVTLPHDAMIAQKRDPSLANGRHKAFFPNGVWEYTKTFNIPTEYAQKHVALHFEGVYNKTLVYCNDQLAGQCNYGYTGFTVSLDEFIIPGAENKLQVICRTGQDGRWYTGAGIYRDVYLLESERIHVPYYGVRATTEKADNNGAVVRVDTTLANLEQTKTVTLITALCAPDGTIISRQSTPVTVCCGEQLPVSQRFYVDTPQLWDVDVPQLYTICTTLECCGAVLDTVQTTFGIRTLTLDRCNGLRLNGKTVKLRGACIHHDHGVVGAATLYHAEERRVRKLKEAGFNAIRMSHHPAAPVLLDACDRLGMLVMDEAFDMWTECKNPDDYAVDFAAHWEQDVAAMVAKDYNHPSVVLYSIGNEIPETGTPQGSRIGRLIANKIRSLDSTRYTTNSINGFLSVKGLAEKLTLDAAQQDAAQPNADINQGMIDIGEGLAMVMRMPVIGEATAESFAAVDVAGYNYMDSRYEQDKELYPGRIICGSETHPSQIDRNWQLVKNNDHVIGDFTWTGWDYLGEVGIGSVNYNTGVGMTFNAYESYPWLTAWTGDLDITGHRRPASYYREIVFGLRKEPYIAVQRPEHYHDTPTYTLWSWTDSLSGWTWAGFEGKPVKVEVYANADEVELLRGRTYGLWQC